MCVKERRGVWVNMTWTEHQVDSICNHSLFNRSRTTSFSIVEFSSSRSHAKWNIHSEHSGTCKGAFTVCVCVSVNEWASAWRTYVFAHEIVETILCMCGERRSFLPLYNEIQLIIHMMFALWCGFPMLLFILWLLFAWDKFRFANEQVNVKHDDEFHF